MKIKFLKNIVILLAVLILAACGNQPPNYYEPNDNFAIEAYIGLDEVAVLSEEADKLCPHENVLMPTPPHPFATALREYMAGYDGVVHAYLASLDDDGTIGVLTTRPTTRFRAWDEYDDRFVYDYGISGALFYIQDGELFQIDVSSWWLYVAGRYNRLMTRIYGHTHIVEVIYKLEFGRLEISTQLEYFSDEYLAYLHDDYDAVAESIARRDARAKYAREKYGLVAQLPPNLGHMRNTEDQTAQILAMTINCVPSLASVNGLSNEYALCDCGAFFARDLQMFTSAQPLNIRDLDPFGFNTHFTYQFETVHTATYLQWEMDFPNKIAIWSDEPVYDFSFVSVHHNAICCAYVGDTLLVIDKLYTTDVVLLTVAFWHYLFPRGGVIFTDAMGMRHHMFLWESMAGGCAPGFLLSPTNNLLDLRGDWLDLEIISIPSAFTYDKGGPHNDIVITTSCPVASSENVWGATQMRAGYLKVDSIELMIESSLTVKDFLFDDGHVGYMLEFADEIWWVRNDWMSLSFRHGGYRLHFEIHENLILEIARTLTAPLVR